MTPDGRFTVLRPVRSQNGILFDDDLVTRATAGETEAVRILIGLGGYTSLGDLTPTAAGLPISQAGDILIAHETGSVRVSTGRDHQSLAGLIDGQALAAAPFEAEDVYGIQFATRALPQLVQAMTALDPRPPLRIADDVRAARPVRMRGRDVHRLVIQALDMAGRINQAVVHWRQPASEAVHLTDIVTQIRATPMSG